ncbi:phenylacetaldehyde reductase [Acrasis kona]|uniref:Phenylacetaldehyde reductase n=1 Tax=Acrasis kona TaxID=1008807 RepID=A0AAW2Z942_9EUKA
MSQGVKVAVTGAGGYIASALVKELLVRGYQVNGTVRDPSDNKYSHLSKLVPEAEQSLKLFSADLLQEGSFKDAFEGVKIVFHTASPFQRQVEDPQRDLVDPAVKGTMNVLKQAKESGVDRVVLTASVATIIRPSTIDHLFTHEDWNTEATIESAPYPFSKTEAEKAAWKFAKENDLKLTTIHPGLVFGPVNSSRTDATSVKTVKSLLDGTHQDGAPDMVVAISDIRDIVLAHIVASEKEIAINKRYMVTSRKQYSMIDIADVLRKKYPNAKLPVDGVQTHKKQKFDSSLAEKELGVTLTPFESSVLDFAESLIDFGIVKLDQ